MSDVERFYDGLADDYPLIYADWDAAVRRQGELIERWIGVTAPGTTAGAIAPGATAPGATAPGTTAPGPTAPERSKPLRVLDAACGPGTQAIALALRGHHVVGRDLSPRLIERARREAERFGVELDLAVGDLRDLEAGTGFDAVIALDNALPHLADRHELERALRCAHEALRPGGSFVASIRDYDRLAVERPTLDPPRVLGGDEDRRIVLQHWDWDADGSGYTMSLLILVRSPDGEWALRSLTGRYRALRRAEVDQAAERAGFAASRWIDTEDSGFYQPVFEARRSS